MPDWRRRSLFAALPLVSAAAEATWPAPPIRMIIPFVPGGSTDRLARVVSPRLSERLGQSVPAENRPGASTNLANDFVAKAKPSGATLLFGAATIAAAPRLFHTLPYDLFGNLAPSN